MPCDVQTTTIPVEIQTAIIGVVATILGTVLGWILNNLSNKGKLCFYIKQWSDKFECNKAGEMTQCDSIDDAECYSFKLNMDVYNSSAVTKIMRNIQVVFANGKNTIRAVIPKDSATRNLIARTNHYDDVEPINISPKKVFNIELCNWKWDKDKSIRDYLNTTNVYIQYTDEKNRTKKIKVINKDYGNYFIKLREDQTNGQTQNAQP